MNIIWYVLRSFYLLGLMPAVPFFFIVANHAGKDIEASIPLLICCVGYFVLGYVLLKVVPDLLRARVLARVERHKDNGFAPQWEVVSVFYNRYVGFDPKTRKALYVDVNDRTETLVDFDNVNAWELDVDKNKPALLKLLTRIPTLPVLGLRIDRRKADEWKANLGMIFD
ncbi:hypothetical protein [Xanthomonas fragariae]|uniref:hypothetical protein n=1 Tax=Xanthomonas fragariae TaxID=48664 RepID=UPI0022AA01BF|nr:hypothetical protein [Xanthomonas fragariae]WAT15244.1 hypothetical protein OZ429_01485 [Xanthomonas fragariae]